jgi:succinate dehydrogenase hydrophobic anchor subunit
MPNVYASGVINTIITDPFSKDPTRFLFIAGLFFVMLGIIVFLCYIFKKKPWQ